VTQVCQRLHALRGQPLLQRNGTRVALGKDAKAGAVQRRLRVSGIIQHGGDHLHVPLGLHETAHHAKRAKQFAVAGCHGRDDGMVGAFARGKRVGMRRVE